MTALDLPAIRALLEGVTEGPWRWRNTNGEAMLMGGGSRLVMGFSRMGMNGAQPEFRDADGLMVKAGKENINAYPDAAFIAAAPSIVAQLLAVVERVEGLHVPVVENGEAVGCKTCDWEVSGTWPCETIQAITGEGA